MYFMCQRPRDTHFKHARCTGVWRWPAARELFGWARFCTKTMSTCSRRDYKIAFSAEDLIATNTVQTVALIHATSGKVKFLGMYVGVITDPKGKRRGLKALEKRRRVIHRLRMLQKQRKDSWEKEVGRIALQSFTRGYRKVLNTLKSGLQMLFSFHLPFLVSLFFPLHSSQSGLMEVSEKVDNS